MTGRAARESLNGALPDETRVVYVSPGRRSPPTSTRISPSLDGRSGDWRRRWGRRVKTCGSAATPCLGRASTPNPAPHPRNHTRVALPASHGGTNRKMLSTVRTVIVDEIHAGRLEEAPISR